MRGLSSAIIMNPVFFGGIKIPLLESTGFFIWTTVCFACIGTLLPESDYCKTLQFTAAFPTAEHYFRLLFDSSYRLFLSQFMITVQNLLKTIRLSYITPASAGRSRSVKNAADTKHFAALRLAKCKYRRFSRPFSTGVMHERRSKTQVSLNCNSLCRYQPFFLCQY